MVSVSDEVKELKELAAQREKEFKEVVARMKSLETVVWSQQRLLSMMMMEKYSTKGSEEEWRKQLLGGLAEVVAPSAELVPDDAAFESEASFYKEVYELAKDKKSDSLRKGAAQMLGPLILKSDSKQEDFEFTAPEAPSFFSAKTFPRLKSEEEYLDKVDKSLLHHNTPSTSAAENGTSVALKSQLIRLVDLPMLSYAKSKYVRSMTNNKQFNISTEEMEKSNLVPKRKYQNEPNVVFVTEADTRKKDSISKWFTSDTKCVVDASGFVVDGKLDTEKINKIPANVANLSFVNGESCTEIGNGVLNDRSDLKIADFSGLHVTTIGDKFLYGCDKLEHLCLPRELMTHGYGFPESSPSLEIQDTSTKGDVPTVKVREADLQNDAKLQELTNRAKKDANTRFDIDVSSGFLDDKGKLDSDKVSKIPAVASHICFINGDKCVAVADDFLNGRGDLKIVDLSKLKNVMSIGDRFLFGCTDLDTVNLPEKLQVIGYDFLDGCNSFKAKDDVQSKYKIGVVVTEADLQDDDVLSAVTERFKSSPDGTCVFDISVLVDGSGKLISEKLDRLPQTVGCIAFINGESCKAIGNEFLGKHSSLRVVDLSCLKTLTETDIGNYSEHGWRWFPMRKQLVRSC
eukprot:TRINITY_DN655_c0_g5_i1.p1 TRINITY_DN655_c0_g5~~TRINITY_DN655_c0_g5_i1.p1  ORF type:complete len:629 (+),score=118.74 TRINITY_DN655_c0_g5_i1:56-1942(+)